MSGSANLRTGHFQTPLEQSFNSLSFFTVQSNLLVGVATLVLALGGGKACWFPVLRLTSVIASPSPAWCTT